MTVVQLHRILLLALLCCISSYSFVQAIKEPRTGLEFGTKLLKQNLQKWGVRTKGPFKVYAVGLYGDSMFLLQMHMNVNAQKMASALRDALEPRCRSSSCGATDLSDFETLLLEGLPDGASKGTRLLFDTSKGKLSITINDTKLGSFSSKPLAKAFAGIYTDRNAVCALKAVDHESTSTNDSTVSWPVLASLLIVGLTTLLIYWYLYRSPSTTRSPYVSELNIYPIKSCGAQSVPTARPTLLGFQHDRVFQITDKQRKYCTPRDTDKARLFHVTPVWQKDDTLKVTSPHVDEPLMIDVSSSSSSPSPSNQKQQVSVEVLGCPGKLSLDDYGPEAAQWMQRATNIPGCRLTGIGNAFARHVRVNDDQGEALPAATTSTKSDPVVSLADEAPYLLTSTASLADLNYRLHQRGQAHVDMRRFRPNIVVSGSLPAWREDTWKRIRIDSVEFYVWQRCGRCTMTTIDRDTLQRGPEPLATLSTFREREHGMRNFGMHLIPVAGTLQETSTIGLGNNVEVLEVDEERQAEWEKLFGSS